MGGWRDLLVATLASILATGCLRYGGPAELASPWQATLLVESAAAAHQPEEPGPPLKGPLSSEVIQPP